MNTRDRVLSRTAPKRLAFAGALFLVLAAMLAAAALVATPRAYAAVGDTFTADIQVGNLATPCRFTVVSDTATFKTVKIAGEFSGYDWPELHATGTPAVSPYVTGELVVPAAVTNDGVTYTVSALDTGAFYECTGITEVTLPQTVLSIGDGAFWWCTGIDELELPGTVMSIGDFAFANCSGIGTISAPGAKTIGKFAFANCSGATELSLPDTVTTIGNSAFMSCSGLQQVFIPASVTSLGESAFVACTALQKARFAAKSPLATLPTTVFASCTGLTELELPSGLTGIDSAALRLTAIKSINLPATVTSISANAFESSSLTSITIPAAVTEIGMEAFKSCLQLRQVTFADSSRLATIGYAAFEECSGIESLDIPDSVTTIGGSALKSCTGLTSLSLPENAEFTEIPDSMASSCTGLADITIPSNVTTIGGGAFYYCEALNAVTVPASVKSIGGAAFGVCSALVSLTLEGTEVKTIADDSFIEYTGIVGGSEVGTAAGFGKVYVAANLVDTYKAAATKAGANWGNHIASVVDRPADTQVYALLKADNTLVECTNTGAEVSGGHVYNTSGTGANKDRKCDTITDLFFADGITKIGDDGAHSYLFTSDGAITSITIPASVKSIGEDAFWGCCGLTSVTFEQGSTLEQVGQSAFASCAALRSIKLPDTAALAGSAFNNCYALESANIPSANTNISNYLFCGCYLLGSTTDGTIELPQNLANLGEIEQAAFASCNSLTSISLPTSADGTKGIYRIAEGAFESSGLTSVTIPADVTYVDTWAFAKCYQLSEVAWNASKDTATYSDPFYNCNALVKVTFGDIAATTLGPLFTKCTGLSDVSIPSGVAVLDKTFSECKALKDIDIPQSVKTLTETFYGCYALSQVTLPEGMETLTESFMFCSALPSIIIPDSVTTLAHGSSISAKGNGVFTDCTALAYVGFSGTPKVTVLDDFCFSCCSVLPSIDIPSSVTAIDNNAFASCVGLTNVNMPNTLAAIGSTVFSHCTSLPSLTIPDSVTYIGDNAFRYCIALTSLKLPAGLTEIHGALCAECSALTKITIPAAVTKFSYDDTSYPFQDCTALRTVIFENDCAATTFPTGDNWTDGYPAFYGCTKLAYVVYRDKKPAEKALSYENLDPAPQFYYSVNYYRNAEDAAAKRDRIDAVAVKAGTKVDGTAAPAATDIYDGSWAQASTFESGVKVSALDDSCWAIPTSWKGVVATEQPEDAVVGANGQATLTFAAQIEDQAGTPQTGTVTYQWYTGSTAAMDDAQAVSGATSSSYTTPKNLTAGPHYYYCKVTTTQAGVSRTTLDSNTVCVTMKTGSVSADPTSLAWDIFANYSASGEGKEVTIKNTSAATVTGIRVSCGTSSFTATPDFTSLAPQESESITVYPASGLGAGTYSDTLTVSSDNAVDTTVALSMTIKPVAGAAVTASPTTLDFGSAKVGYGTQTSKTVRVTNTGKTPVTVYRPSVESYSWSGDIPAGTGVTLQPDTSIDITVAPSTGLEEGTHDETLQMDTDVCGTLSVALKFTVTGNTPSAKTVTRLWDGTALGTMVKITSAGWKDNSCSTVVVATMDGYWDALSASALAGLDANDCPVLITSGTSLSAQAASEIKRLGADKVYIAGGTAAVSDGVKGSIEALGVSTERLSGDNAVGTSLDIYEEGTKAGANGTNAWGTTCIVATNDGYWDALAASPFAYDQHAPIFLYNAGTGQLDDSVVDAIRDGGFTRVIVCGGTGAVKDTVETQLKGLGSVTAVDRYGGKTAVETSALIAQACLDAGMHADGVAVATNGGYWDALTGAALCGKNGAPLVLASDGNRGAITGFVADHKADITEAYVFGGTSAVSTNTYNAVVAALK